MFCGAGLQLAAQSRLQVGHGLANPLGVVAGVGGLQGLRGVNHRAVTGTQMGLRFFPLGGLAVKGLVNRATESIPQLLLQTPVQRNALGQPLPALLQRFDCVNPQLRRSAQGLRLVHHGPAQSQVLRLYCFQGCSGVIDCGLPQGLQFGESFFAQVSAIAPTVAKLHQNALKTLPIAVQSGAVVGCPRIHLGNQGQALGAVLHRVGLDFFQPGFHHLVGIVAGVVKAFPQGVVGYPALVSQFPLLAQGAQRLLHLAPANGLAFGALQQAFGLGHQLLAQLVGAPALPALQFTGGSQRGLGAGL